MRALGRAESYGNPKKAAKAAAEVARTKLTMQETKCKLPDFFRSLTQEESDEFFKPIEPKLLPPITETQTQKNETK